MGIYKCDCEMCSVSEIKVAVARKYFYAILKTDPDWAMGWEILDYSVDVRDDPNWETVGPFESFASLEESLRSKFLDVVELKPEGVDPHRKMWHLHKGTQERDKPAVETIIGVAGGGKVFPQ